MLNHTVLEISASRARHHRLEVHAIGVLWPISKLAPNQVKYHFMSGYAAKLAGSEEILRQQEAWTSSGKSANEITKTALGPTGLFQKNKTSQASAHIRTLIGR